MEPTELQVDLPSGWEVMGEDELAQNGAKAVRGFVRADGTGRVIVVRDPPLRDSLHQTAIALRHRLRETVSDYRHIGERMVALPAGEGLTTSYARTEHGTAESITIVPLEACTYSLVTVVVAGEEAAALEAASIISSFAPSPASDDVPT